MSLLHKRHSLGTRKVSPPQPTCMSDEQKATYLSNLRKNRPARPSGSRPLPSRPISIRNDDEQDVSSYTNSTLLSQRREEAKRGDDTNNTIAHSMSMPVLDIHKGRPLAQPPKPPADTVLRTGSSASISYHESTSRRIEKQEAHSIRQALAKIDLKDDETRIHSAAQMEAADLVWKHRNPQLAEHEKTSAYRNPDLVKKRYVVQNRGSALDTHKRSESAPSDLYQEDRVEPLKLSKRGSQMTSSDTVVNGISHQNRRKSSGTRQTSNGSSKSLFRNPIDQIYEEPENLEVTKQETSEEPPLQSRTGNELHRGSRPLPGKPCSVPLPTKNRFDTFEMYKNPPVHFQDADYDNNDTPPRSQTPEQVVETPKGRAMEIRSDEIRAATSMKRKDRSPKLPTPTAVSDKPGRPIVSFDPAWRSENASARGSLDMDRRSLRPNPSPIVTVSAPAVPTIKLPDDDIDTPTKQHQFVNVPQICLPDEESVQSMITISAAQSVPTINLPDDDPVVSSVNVPTINLPTDNVPTRTLPIITPQARPLPTPRPLPCHTKSSPPKLPPTGNARSPASRLPWLSRSPTNLTMSGSRTATVVCTACELPISGRIVTASGSSNSNIKARFHPECFNCFHCSTALECVSFYPEPESALLERLGLTDSQGQDTNGTDQLQPVASDLRFYCHLDFHELFSPKCASCHTPIEGAVILAAGKAWHEGHFFCGECGDPFSSTSPFVESKGYAYCVSCHTKRTAARCRGCKKQILDEISVEALGGKWHEGCFVCFECERDFGDEGRFFVREIEVDLTEKEKRKGADYKRIEERAVCERCEGRRLKAWNVNAFV